MELLPDGLNNEASITAPVISETDPDSRLALKQFETLPGQCDSPAVYPLVEGD
jgi:hypothetical protein